MTTTILTYVPSQRIWNERKKTHEYEIEKSNHMLNLPVHAHTHTPLRPIATCLIEKWSYGKLRMQHSYSFETHLKFIFGFNIRKILQWNFKKRRETFIQVEINIYAYVNFCKSHYIFEKFGSLIFVWYHVDFFRKSYFFLLEWSQTWTEMKRKRFLIKTLENDQIESRFWIVVAIKLSKCVFRLLLIGNRSTGSISMKAKQCLS